jgi:hypothetical protein
VLPFSRTVLVVLNMKKGMVDLNPRNRQKITRFTID